ncbi:3-beta hydroxysteroid dehydrogenase [Niastella koreensis]|uniref:3-beta hydroxysteroid dehydrogenase/isomerase n=2 Tax=Niastella koreensis TaxID=354356 RepID=G8T949_NIAKG|nr:aldehyde reductase [Niastella koreensis]AEV97002.1 3-beta hydroxysteroid dehydrogenase/isomerase [Niastella koreensis GR20-10]OQP39304.1 3-beta hydroxysteroid dehydrogenase [Niastella koreensis]
MEQKTNVLVTGGSGFLGAHCILQLLHRGYSVKTTVRSINQKIKVIEKLKNGGITTFEDLSFIETDLTKDDNWPDAVKDCKYVLHTASPFPSTIPKDERELIVPAVEGTRRVLQAARDAKVQRIVVTSSFAAVGYGYAEKNRVFTEKDWTRLNSEIPVLAYQKSKTLAEKEAWDFIAKQGKGLELAVINPVGILGPVLSPETSTSTESIRKLLNGMPGVPNISFGVVDVRDVADLHIGAMLSPAANGERFLAVAGEPLSVKEMADILKSHLGDAAKKVPSRILPDWLVKFAALLDPTLKSVVPGLGKYPAASNQKAKDILKWAPRSNEETVLATAESLFAFGLIKR